MSKKKAPHPIWRSFLIYVAATLLFAGGLIVPAYSGVSKVKIMNWYGVVLFTSCIFGTFLMEGRSVWRKKRFGS
jgi:ABC-type glycerol-3-phosphate transport system permease component